MSLSLKVAQRYAADLPVTLERRVEQTLDRVHGVKGALVVDYSEPNIGTLDVAAEVVLDVKEAVDGKPAKFAAPLSAMESTISRALKGMGASRVSFQSPKLARGVYDSDTVMVSFLTSDAP